jgi:beta-lactam-binding protein with PASTA domain
MTGVIGLTIEQAEQRLKSLGFAVRINEYVSKRGIEDADSTRVVRQRKMGENEMELTVSHFKTHLERVE